MRKLRWHVGAAAEGFQDGAFKLDRQRGFQHHHGGVRQCPVTGHLDAISRVGVEDLTLLRGGGADGVQAVLMRAFAALKTVLLRSLAEKRLMRQ